jgi:hypothetical protein
MLHLDGNGVNQDLSDLMVRKWVKAWLRAFSFASAVRG